MKKMLSLALALVLCLSLAVPVLAANAPYTYEQPDLEATNVIAQDEDSEYITLTCIAPAVFTIGKATAATELRAYKVTESGLADYAGDKSEASTVTIAEAGEYRLHLGLYINGEFVFDTYNVTVQSDGEAAPTVPTTDPTTTDPDTKFFFTDVKESDWFYDAVQWALEKGITNGTGKTTFSPGQDCTEAHILTFIWRAKGCPEPEGAVESDTYYAKAAKWAVEQGIIDEFEADAPCTRAMTVDFLWRAAGKPQSDEKTPFTDVTAGTDLEKAVAWAVGAGVTNGTSETTFSPGTVCTRGHIVTFLYRNLAE